MPHETPLIATIAMALVCALIGGFAAARLRLPPLVGYLLAGVAVGPFTPGFVADGKLAAQLAEIGVIMLMFGVGMHFSLRDLLSVRAVAVPGALVQVAAATGMGAALAHLWGWAPGAGLVFGLTLSIASTVVLLRALDGLGLLGTEAGRLAVGWLVVEDLLTVLVLVLLPPLAGLLGGTPAPAGTDLPVLIAITLGKVAGFVAFMLVIGARVLPWFLDQVERTGSRELFTVAVVAIAIGVAYGSATLLDLSYALGAFFAGVVLRESGHSARAGADARPLTDALAVLFFVAVGMLFDPAVLVREPLRVLAVVAVIALGKSVVAAIFVLALRQGRATALIVAASLGQIGEFSFILAELGEHVGVLPHEATAILVAGALVTITLNPLLFRLAGAYAGSVSWKRP